MWTLRSGTSDAGDRIFSRPLGDTEVSFHWDGAFSGTADCIMHQNIEISHDARHQVTKDSFRQAWLALKRRFPILGAQVEERESGTILEFVVNESCLSDIGPGEMGFLEGGADVASQVVEDALNGPRKLSNNLHASIVIIQPQGERLTFHVVVIVAHVITDGMGNSTLIRNFLEGLASSDRTAPPDLPGRLAMAMCSESLAPTLALSHARRRWRNAIARIIWQRSQSALQGGHGLPGRRSPQTTTTPAISKQASIILLPSLSQAVIKSCRAHSITFGHAFPVIAQLALSRSLHRRYLRGEIPEEEWQYRLRQPTHTGGPLNLRPFLKKEWVAAGGEHELNIHINFFFITLPRMAQSSLGAESDFSGAPSFSSLLSPQRFFLRCELVKRQMSQYMKHPLFYEVISQRGPIYAERKRNIALLWRRRQAGEPISPEEIAATTGVDGGLVLAHGGSSRGNVCIGLWNVYCSLTLSSLSRWTNRCPSNIQHPGSKNGR